MNIGSFDIDCGNQHKKYVPVDFVYNAFSVDALSLAFY